MPGIICRPLGNGIPYFAYMISVIAELINNVITWAKSRITGISITGLYITGGTIFMIVIPAKIFVEVEGKQKESQLNQSL